MTPRSATRGLYSPQGSLDCFPMEETHSDLAKLGDGSQYSEIIAKFIARTRPRDDGPGYHMDARSNATPDDQRILPTATTSQEASRQTITLDRIGQRQWRPSVKGL